MERAAPAETPSGRRRPPRPDAANLAGITSLMNPQALKPGVNLEDAEKRVMGHSRPRKAEADPVALYTAELQELSASLGVDFLDGAPAAGPRPAARPAARPPAKPAATARPPIRVDQISRMIAPVDLGPVSGRAPRRGRRDSSASGSSTSAGSTASSGSSASSASSASGSASGSASSGTSGGSASSGSSGSSASSGSSGSSGSYASGSSGSGSSGSSGSYTSGSSGSGSSGSGSSGSGSSGSGSSGRSRRSRRDDVDDILRGLEADLHTKLPRPRKKEHRRRHREPAPRTEEQTRRLQINSVVADVRRETRTTFGVERERLQDQKASMLEQIGQLRLILEEEGIDCSCVGRPTADSPLEEIDSALKILRLKNDRNRCSSLAEEVLLGGAELLGTVFDGTQAVPLVGWKPDYRGFHNTLGVKLGRLRFETSTLVGEIVERNNLGPFARMALEVLPSLFLYPRQRAAQRGSAGVADELGSQRAACRAINDAERRKDLGALEGV